MRTGTKRALIKLMCFFGLTIASAIIYGTIIGSVTYFLGDTAGLIARIVTIIILAGSLCYDMVRDENKKDKKK